MLLANIPTRIRQHQIDSYFAMMDTDRWVDRSYFALIAVAKQHWDEAHSQAENWFDSIDVAMMVEYIHVRILQVLAH
jgi:hypothetical protein